MTTLIILFSVTAGRPAEGLSKRQKKRLQRRLSRANAVLREADNSPVVNGHADSNGQPRLKLNNTFGLLNHSQHHDPESEALSNKRLVNLLNGHSNGSTRSVTPEGRLGTARSTPSHKALKKPSAKKRCKSNSPPRESLMSKRKDLIKNFDPDNVDWIQTNSTKT